MSEHEGCNYFVSHCRSDIKVHKWLCTLYAGENWIAALGLRAGSHHVAINIINSFGFHTHMIDDFLFSNPTAQHGRLAASALARAT